MNASLSPWRVAFSGLAGLAVAIGIGRFAYTPILPMMQADQGLSLAQGGWIAVANLLGYLAGGLTAARFRIKPVRHLRLCLLLMALSMLLMALVSHTLVWAMVRFMAGMVSAWMMVMVSILCLPHLVSVPRLAGWVYAGVGTGTAIGGLVCLFLVLIGASSTMAWLGLAAACVVFGVPVWRTFQPESIQPQTKPVASEVPMRLRDTPAAVTTANDARLWRLVICYGLYGFGYILPATYLPAQARLLLQDGWLYSLAWPVFGIAAALSTLLAAVISARFGRLPTWIGAHLVMGVGVLVPTVWPSLSGILVAALCVGGTFVVITLVAMQEAQHHGAGQAGIWMARLTTAFGAGQILGPLVVIGLGDNLVWGLWLAGAVLWITAWTLYRQMQQEVDKSQSSYTHR
jgi:MFS family permease